MTQRIERGKYMSNRIAKTHDTTDAEHIETFTNTSEQKCTCRDTHVRRRAAGRSRMRILALLLTVVLTLQCAAAALAAAETDAVPISLELTDSQAAAVITRGELCDMLLEAADFYNPGVKASDIIKGYPDGTTREDQNVTRAEFVVMTSRAFGKLPVPVGDYLLEAAAAPEYTDAPKWAQADIDALVNARLLTGRPDGLLYPQDTITRDEAQLIINRVYALYGTNPKDDFYAAVNKSWLDTAVIPSGFTYYGAFAEVEEKVNAQIEKIFDEILAGSWAAGSKEQRIKDVYNTIIDMEGRNKAGVAPLQPYLDAIENAQDQTDLHEANLLMIEELGDYTYGPGVAISVSFLDSTQYALYAGASAPTFPKETYDDPENPMVQLLQYSYEKLLTLAGDSDPAGNAARAIAYETDIAAYQHASDDIIDYASEYTPYTLAEMQALYDSFDFKEIIAALGFKEESVYYVANEAGFIGYGKYLAEADIETLKAANKVSLLVSYASMLSQDFVDAYTEYNMALTGASPGTAEQAARSTTMSMLTNYVGEKYIEKYFTAEAKADIESMISEFIAAYKLRIDALTWMSDETKQAAIKKLDTMTVKVGYPDEFDYRVDAAELLGPEDGGSLFSNYTSIMKTALAAYADAQGKPVDKGEWFVPVFTVNAFYNPQGNEIVFPAAFLQAPFYSKDASKESNLGGVGWVIAHEISHAFDINGSQFDEKGNVVTWWQMSDYIAFQELCGKVIEHYEGAEAVAGLPINGTTTLGENTADIAGMACVLDVLAKMPDPDYKAFFESAAVSWTMTMPREMAEYLVMIDVHSPGKLRVNKVVQNFQEFYDTYDIQPGDGMYLAPEDRETIW